MQIVGEVAICSVDMDLELRENSALKELGQNRQIRNRSVIVWHICIQALLLYDRSDDCVLK